MVKEAFFAEFRKCGGVRLTEDYVLFRKPVELYNITTNKSKLFRTVVEAFDEEIGSTTVGEIIEKADMSIFEHEYDGRGSSGGGEGSTFRFGNGGGNGPDNTTSDFPSRVNINSETSPERALEVFRNLHAGDENQEHAFTVDERGYVTRYVHGNASSVRIAGSAGEMVYHNHPSGGAFSKADLQSTALEPAKGIVASGKNGDYILTKSNGFKANEFVKAVGRVKMRGKDYDDAVDQWLTRNQKKYGYKYVFRKAQ